MNSFLLIGICIITGMLLNRFRLAPANTYKWINLWLIWGALPAVSFKYLPYLKWTSDLLLPAAMPLIVFALGVLYVHFYTRFYPVDMLSKGSMILTAGLGNTSFIGFPLIMAYYGEFALGTAVVCDQITFLLLSTVGLIVAVKFQGNGQFSWSKIALRVLCFPPFIGCVLALTIPRAVDISILNPLFSWLAYTVGPLALLSIGLQLSFKGLKKEWQPVTAIVVYKLLLAPFVISLIVLFIGTKSTSSVISIFEAAMPVQLSTGIVAAQYNLNVNRTNTIIGISIILSFITTAVWYYVLGFLM